VIREKGKKASRCVMTKKETYAALAPIASRGFEVIAKLVDSKQVKTNPVTAPSFSESLSSACRIQRGVTNIKRPRVTVRIDTNAPILLSLECFTLGCKTSTGTSIPFPVSKSYRPQMSNWGLPVFLPKEKVAQEWGLVSDST